MPQKLLKNIIKSIILLIFIGAGLPKMYAGSVLLSKRISINVQKQSIEKVLHLIEKKAEVQFMYNPQMFNLKKVVTLQLQNSSIKEILQNLINNKDIVFYEMGKYIVLTNKLQAPVQANVISAIPSTQQLDYIDKTTQHRLILDTIHTYDTIKINKTVTNRVNVFDTITIFDTVRTFIKKEIPTNSVSTKAVSNTKWFSEIAYAPTYSDLLTNSKWLSDLSMSTRLSIGIEHNNISFSIGVGSLWQRGLSVISETSLTVDSILQKDSVKIIQKYKTGDYYYIIGNDTIHKVIYDSSLVTIPRHWYNKTQHSTVKETTVNYSILWITIPCKFAYNWSITKKSHFDLGLCFTPAFAFKKYGQIYSLDDNNTVPTSKIKLATVAFFISIEPAFSYSLSNSIALNISPILQCSINPLLYKSGYYFGGGAQIGIRKYFSF